MLLIYMASAHQPITFEEDLEKIKNQYQVLIEKLIICQKSSHLQSACSSLEKQLNDLKNIKLLNLKIKIKTGIKTLKGQIQILNSRRKKMERATNIYSNNLVRLDRGDLSAEPRRGDAYEIKAFHIINILYYVLGILAMFFFFRAQLKVKVIPKKKPRSIPKAPPIQKKWRPRKMTKTITTDYR
uniref:Uncharacterized protein n=1 Tax=uncultured marine group II/III euryarchaeote AD1000_88_G11 TaxID=1457822 RepID=A0A075G576_9EURY|nr:hypothetical protein [uncultured marine group II/III euryarchaeote AD1000_88_G11]